MFAKRGGNHLYRHLPIQPNKHSCSKHIVIKIRNLRVPLDVYGSSARTSWSNNRRTGQDGERQCTIDKQPFLGERTTARTEYRK